MSKPAFLEICLDTLEDLRLAIAGGADRIELCSALSVGGLTPSAGLVSAALEAARAQPVSIRAMVRPRDGDFAYSTADLAVAEAEGAALIRQGVDGLVFGMTRDGALDDKGLSQWVAAMRAVRPDVGLTLHRAIDLVDDLPGAARMAAQLGFDCILSSGGAVKAAQATSMLAAMQTAVGNTITIMPGSGITSSNVADIMRLTGVRAVHASASGPMETGIDPRLIELGFATGPRRGTRLEEVRALRLAIDSAL